MRSIVAGVASEGPRLSNGKQYDYDIIRTGDPVFANAVAHGIPWGVFNWELEYLYPGLSELLQAARNLAGHMQRVVHEVSGLQQIHTLWPQQISGGAAFGFARINRSILRQKHFSPMTSTTTWSSC